MHIVVFTGWVFYVGWCEKLAKRLLEKWASFYVCPKSACLCVICFWFENIDTRQLLL